MRFHFNCVRYASEVSENEPHYYDVIDKVDLGVKEFNTIWDAQLWLLHNHPDLYFGALITCEDNTDYAAVAPKHVFIQGLKKDCLQALIDDEKMLSKMCSDH